MNNFLRITLAGFILVVLNLTVLPAYAQTPAAPTVSGNLYVCSGGSTTLTASGVSGATFAWYSDAAGTHLLATTAAYTTPALTTATSYYVSQKANGSTSALYQATVLVASNPSITTPQNILASPATICQGQSSNLSATVDASSNQYVYWYDSSVAGNLLGSSASGGNFTVSPTATKKYYAQSQAQIITQTFGFTGNVQTFVVPAGVTSINIDARGGRGGYEYEYRGIIQGSPGNGGRVQATMNVTPGQVLYLYVGQEGHGYDGTYNNSTAYNGGGTHYGGDVNAGGGGGATDIRINGQALTNRVLVAGGGGGTGTVTQAGGAGGGLVGGNGADGNNQGYPLAGSGGKGGSQTAGGAGGDDRSDFANPSEGQVAPAGSLGQGGNSGQGGASSAASGGAGGGGYYGGGGGEDYGGGGGGSSYTDPTLYQNVMHTQGYNNSDGQLIISYNSTANCATATRQLVTVNVNTTPTVGTSGNVITCAGTAVTLTGTGADTYTWMPGSLTGTSVTVNPGSTTTYTVTGKLNNGGCTNTANATVTVTSVSASASQAICLNQSANISASGADTYTWQPGNLSGQSVNVSPTTTTTYTVTGHNNSGCSTTAQTTITVNPLPPVSIGSAQTVAAGTSVTLTATGADTYQWSSPYSANTAALTFQPAATSTWSVTGRYTATGCSVTATAVITVTPQATVTGNTLICAGNTTTLTAAGGGPFKWFSSATSQTALSASSVFTTPAITQDTAFYLSQNGAARLAVNISVIPMPYSASAAPVAICIGNKSILSVSPATQVNWYDAPVGGNLLDSAASGVADTVSPAASSVYYARVLTPAVTQTFNFTGGVQTFVVPAGVTSIQVDAQGGRGGLDYEYFGIYQGNPGNGGRVQATMNVTPGQVLYLYVGQEGHGYDGTYNNSTAYNGGGTHYGGDVNAGGGGGATDIRINGQALTNRVLVAGGGGGTGQINLAGGAGGGLVGGNGADGKSQGYPMTGSGGKGGSQTAGGAGGDDRSNFAIPSEGQVAPAGSLGQGGNSGQGGASSAASGGAGGGGYYGGGGGEDYGGGAGGSSYSDPTLFQNVVHTQGYNNSDGHLIITYATACNVRLADSVKVNPLPPVKIGSSISSDSVGVGSSITLTATGATNYTFTNGAQNGVAFVPPSSALYKVTGTDNNGCVNNDSVYITVIPPPSIASAIPSAGPVGTLVTLSGQNLSALTNITIGGVPAIIISNSSTQAVAMVMPGTSTGSLSITNAFGSGNGGTFTVTPTPVPLAQQGAKFTATGAGGNAQKGYSVAVSADGNTALLGGPSDSSGRGAVWVFTRSSGAWAQQGTKLVGTGVAGNVSGQGSSVALSADGNTAAVGAPSDSTGYGAVWVFTRSNGIWQQQGNKLKPGDATGSPAFGTAIAISADGNTFFTGGQNDNNYAGAGWIFTRSNGVWAQKGSKLSGTGAVGSTILQGFAVALSADGKTALLGGYYDNARKGAAWVFANSNGAWAQQGSKLVGTGAVDGGAFLGAQQGTSVALSADGNTAVIGGSKDNNGVGALWVFTRSGGTWAQQSNKLTGTGNASGSVFLGQSLAVSADGKTVVTGAPSDNNSTGAMWVFANTTGNWVQQGTKLVGTGATGSAAQGKSIAISADGTTALMGSSADNTSTGTAWAYIVQPPTITSFTPASGGVGTVVTINGHYFSGTNSVSIGGVSVASFTVVSDSVITATVANGAATGNVSVTTAGGTASLATFTFVPAPSITSFTPVTAGSGAIVTIKGKYFTGANAVSFGGSAATSFTVMSDTVITAMLSGGATGSVSVTTAGGTATLAGFSYCTSVTPSVTIAASLANPICLGTKVTFTATPVNGGTPLYQWYKNNVAVGTNSATYADSLLNNGDNIWVVMISSAGCAITPSATSNKIIISNTNGASFAYIANGYSHTVSVVNIATGNVDASIAIGNGAGATSVTPDGKKVYATNWQDNSVSVISTATNTVTSTIGGFSQPQDVVVSPDGKKAYVANGGQTNGQFTMMVIDVSADTIITSLTVPSGVTAQWISISADGKTVYVGSELYSKIAVINTVTNTLTSTISTPSPWGMALSPDGTKLYAASYGGNALNVLDAVSGNNLSSIAVQQNPVGVAVSPDGSTVYVTNTTSNSVSVINTATNAVTTTIPVAGNPYGINITPDGSTLITANDGANTASFISTATNTVANSVHVGSSPLGFGNFIGAAPSACAVLTPTAAVTINTATTVCKGTKVTFTAAITNGGTTPAYQWYKNNNKVGTNASTYADSLLNNNDSVWCILTSNAAGLITNTAKSNVTRITVTQPVVPSITIVADKTSPICAKTKVTFTATTVNGGTAPIYEWHKNRAHVGGTGNTYTDSLLNNNDTLWCDVTSSLGCVTVQKVKSNVFVYTVNPLITPTVSIVADVASPICSKTKVTFTATALNGGTPIYEWHKNRLPHTGTNSNIYVDSALQSNDTVWCDITTSLTSCITTPKVKSNVLVYTVNPLITPSVSIAADVASPICSKTKVTFTATAVNGGTPVYEWHKNRAHVGGTSSIYVDSTLQSNDTVWCDITTSLTSCITTPKVKSNVLVYTVNPLITPSVSIVADIASPICAKTKVTFTATAVNGGTPAYEWHKNRAHVGGNSSIYVDSTLQSNDTVWCNITTSLTGCITTPKVKSNVLVYTVNQITPSVSIVADVASPICAKTKVTFTATAVNGGTPIYEWHKNRAPHIGSNSSIYVDSVLQSNDTVWCNITTSLTGCISTPKVKSNVLVYTVNASIPAQPSPISGPTTVTALQTCGYRVIKVAGVTYTWTVPPGVIISKGQGTDTVTVTWGSTSGTITVTASNSCGTAPAPGTLAVTVASGFGSAKQIFSNNGPKVLLYPNPASIVANLSLSGFNGGVIVSVTDMAGRLVWQQDKLTNGSYKIALNGLAQGMYIVTVKNRAGVQALRLVKAN